MKKAMAIFLSGLLCLTMLITPVRAAGQKNVDSLIPETAAGLSGMGGKAGSLWQKQEEFPAGTSACDWTAMALALSQSPEDYAGYLKNLEAYVERNYAESGGLDAVKSTAYHRIALTVLALGGDPKSFGTKSDGTPIDLVADGTYFFSGHSIGAQGLNGWIYALITLDATGAAQPEDARFSREEILLAIVTAQEPDGGFGLTTGSSDVDITAMALQALAPYQQTYPEIIDKALNYLSGAMDDRCLYQSFGEESAESAAQVLLALCALGIDPEEDSRFRQGNETLLTGLNRFRMDDGTYGHTLKDTEGNFLATAQVLLALTSLSRLRSGRRWIFDFTDYAGPIQKAQNPVLYYAAAAVAAVLIICIVIAGKRKKYGKNHR